MNLYENCDCIRSFPDCGAVEAKDSPWCQECRKCIQAGLNDNGDPFSSCKRRSATKFCHLQWEWQTFQWGNDRDALFPNCTSNVPAGPWCDQCRQCWEAEMQEGPEARCSNSDLWGPKTEMCPTNFPDPQDYDTYAAVPPKKIAQTAGISFRWVTF